MSTSDLVTVVLVAVIGCTVLAALCDVLFEFLWGRSWWRRWWR